MDDRVKRGVQARLRRMAQEANPVLPGDATATNYGQWMLWGCTALVACAATAYILYQVYGGGTSTPTVSAGVSVVDAATATTSTAALPSVSIEDIRAYAALHGI